MNVEVAASWQSFLADLRRDVLPIYAAHERDFDEPGIHGRLHIGRCVLFAEFMARYYHERTALRPSLNEVRFAIAFHDSGRRANGPDLWDHESVDRLRSHAQLHPGRFGRDAGGVAAILEGKGNPFAAGIEARIVHDADVLDIMRPCCGHGGREGFREGALIFLGERDEVRDPDVRARLVEEAWAFIAASEARKAAIVQAEDCMSVLMDVLRESRTACPMLSESLRG